jgi:hypothetical protein
LITKLTPEWFAMVAQAQNHRELSFKKGDLIYIRRQVDANWYEGERNALLGILPISYVEIIPAMDSNTLQSRYNPGANPTTLSYNASVAKIKRN